MPSADVAARTVLEAFQRTVATHPERVALRTMDDAVSLTWSDVGARVARLAAGLARLGVRRGDTVALLLSNRPEFHVADLAAMSLGAVPFSIYQTLPPEQMAYVLRDAGARVVIVERALLEPLLEARRLAPAVEHVIVLDGDGGIGTLALEAVVAAAERDATPSVALQPDDLLTLIYTSGTTGPPKGVQLTHDNIMALKRSLEAVLPLPEDGRVISWLPAAHVAERNAHHYLPVIYGFTITSCPNPREIINVLPQVRPTWFFAVPRIWEKIKAGLEARLGTLPEEQRTRVQQALQAGITKVRCEQAGRPVPDDVAAAVARADAELFAPLRAMLGLDQAVGLNVGAAPTPRDVLEFFHAIGLPVSEIWGLSETTGAGTTAPPGRVKIGSVGPAMPGLEVKLASDGEVFVRGPVVMAGYRNLPDKTREAISPEGWFATGDIGELDADGYLRIVDRKKELIINSAGKNMSPANIESVLKGTNPLIGQACVIGDARPYNTALLVLDPDYAPMWAAQHGLAGRSLSELAREPAVRAALEEAVATANARLARVEQVKRFHVVGGDWLAGGDELTPTMKLKRKPIAEKYAAEIEAMYRGGGAE